MTSCWNSLKRTPYFSIVSVVISQLEVLSLLSSPVVEDAMKKSVKWFIFSGALSSPSGWILDNRPRDNHPRTIAPDEKCPPGKSPPGKSSQGHFSSGVIVRGLFSGGDCLGVDCPDTIGLTLDQLYTQALTYYRNVLISHSFQTSMWKICSIKHFDAFQMISDGFTLRRMECKTYLAFMYAV